MLFQLPFQCEGFLGRNSIIPVVGSSHKTMDELVKICIAMLVLRLWLLLQAWAVLLSAHS